MQNASPNNFAMCITTPDDAMYDMYGALVFRYVSYHVNFITGLYSND